MLGKKELPILHVKLYLPVVIEEAEDLVEVLESHEDVTPAFDLDVSMVHVEFLHLLDPPASSFHAHEPIPVALHDDGRDVFGSLRINSNIYSV